MQMSQSVGLGAIIFWLLAAIRNLKSTSLAFLASLQWLHSLSLLDIHLPPNLAQFLEGFKYANFFFIAHSPD